MQRLALLTIFVLALSASAGQHLFILSGQSNMVGMKPEESFTPAVEAAFGKDRVVVVKDAQGAQPIRRWYKEWTAADGTKPTSTGDLYDRLMTKVKAAVANKEIDSVTFVWMQGERDAREKHGDVYARSFLGILDQLATDLGRDDLNFVIGRLSDYDLKNARYPHWTKIRDIQVKFATDSPRGEWVDTDDLNDGKNRQGKNIRNDLHYAADGYVKLDERFAQKAISLIQQR